MMKKITLLILAAFVLAGCGMQDGTSTNLQEIPGGVEQGNGLVQYENSVMGLKFAYPRNWSLSESADKKQVQLNNAAVAGVFTTSLEFSYLTQLEGRSFKSVAELRSYIESSRPDRKWREVVMLSNLGVMWSESVGMKDKAEYFILDQNHFVIHVNYSADRKFDGEKIVREIIRGMILDEEPPVIESVWFDKAEVRPGERIRLHVKASDRLSGVQIESMGGKSRNQSISGYLTTQNGAVGYFFPKLPGWSDAITMNLALQAQPFVGRFMYLGDDLYSYEIRIPEKAPLGDMALVQLEVSDYFGNKTRIAIYEEDSTRNALEKYQVYRGRLDSRPVRPSQSSLDRVGFRVTADPGHQEDRAAPKISDLYFDKTSLDLGDLKISMYLLFEDDSEVPYERYRSVEFSKEEEDIALTWSAPEFASFDYCAGNLTGSYEKLGRNFYRRVLDLTPCKFSIEESIRKTGLVQTRVVVKPTSLTAWDANGLRAEIKEDVLSAIPRAKFFIRLK
jgi:hypothetical protein